MKKFLIIAAAVACTALAIAVPATASHLGVDVGSLLPATSYTYQPDIRDLNGRVNNLGLTTDPQVGELTLDDATGVVLTTPTTVALGIVKAAPLACGKTRGSIVCSATAGTLKTLRSGLYEATCACGKATGVNSQVLTCDVVEQVGSATAAVLTPQIHGELTNAATALATVSVQSRGLVEVTDGDAAAGAIFSFALTGSAGNVTCKEGRFQLRKVGELNPPTTRETY